MQQYIVKNVSLIENVSVVSNSGSIRLYFPITYLKLQIGDVAVTVIFGPFNYIVGKLGLYVRRTEGDTEIAYRIV